MGQSNQLKRKFALGVLLAGSFATGWLIFSIPPHRPDEDLSDNPVQDPLKHGIAEGLNGRRIEAAGKFGFAEDEYGTPLVVVPRNLLEGSSSKVFGFGNTVSSVAKARFGLTDSETDEIERVWGIARERYAVLEMQNYELLDSKPGQSVKVKTKVPQDVAAEVAQDFYTGIAGAIGSERAYSFLAFAHREIRTQVSGFGANGRTISISKRKDGSVNINVDIEVEGYGINGSNSGMSMEKVSNSPYRNWLEMF